jgi:hypothetical protein
MHWKGFSPFAFSELSFCEDSYSVSSASAKPAKRGGECGLNEYWSVPGLGRCLLLSLLPESSFRLAPGRSFCFVKNANVSI